MNCNGECNGKVIITDLENGVFPFSYNWSNGNTDTINDNLCSGKYTIRVTDNKNCELLDTFFISQPDSILLDIDVSNISGLNANDAMITVNPTGGVSPYTLTWNTGQNTQTISDLSAGLYLVEVKDKNGCIKVDSIIIHDISSPLEAIKAINFISPNGDGKNDYLIFKNLSLYKNNNLTIFNRWGEILYQQSGYNNDWNGYSNGKILDQGVYFYILEIENVKIKSSLTIIRD